MTIQPPPITTTDLTAPYTRVRYLNNLEKISQELEIPHIWTEETKEMGNEAMRRDGYYLIEEGNTTHASTKIENLHQPEPTATDGTLNHCKHCPTTRGTTMKKTPNNENHMEIVTTSADLITHRPESGKKIIIPHQDDGNKATMIITGEQENKNKARDSIATKEELSTQSTKIGNHWRQKNGKWYG